MRTAVSAEADWDDANDSGPKLMPCGYGPPCNPRNFGGQTCTSLGLRPGALSCDPKTCFLVLSGCGKSGAAGTTSGSTGTAGSVAPPLFGGQPMDAGPLFGGLFGTQPGGGMSGTGAMPGGGSTVPLPGGTPMDDEDGGTPGFFGNGFFGGNPGTGFFGGNFFGGGANNNQGQGNAEADGDDPGN